MKELQDNLNKLWASIIEKQVIDIFNHFILFEIKSINNGEVSFHQLKFNNVKSIYYINDQLPFEPEEDDYLELTSVLFEKERTNEIKVSSKSKEYSYLTSNSNFLIEIWGRELLIEASSVEIDGKLFEVGFTA
ncbi:hypothetical protein [Paenibacillus odorifer]|uniref:Uncharacterized protein n=1 Tax=Paenibacillus odorifer TaxID=189426 RepID=A0AAD0KF94_9BACL|nr:hypothetical protein [Paenibacillus odorifer]AWV32364.1 hypothetical protein CD191_06905 [Paenibacillus odorifer]